MRAEVFAPGAGPPPDGWDAFVRTQRACVLWEETLLEAAAWAGTRPVFAGLVRDAGEPVAAFCGRLGVRPVALRYRAPGRAVTPGWLQTHLPNSFHGGRLYADGLGADGRTAARRAFERAVRRRLGARCLGVLHLDVEQHELADLDGPLRLRRPVTPVMVLHNRWASMEAWFAALPRDRRRRLAALYDEVSASPDLTVDPAAPALDPVRASRLDQLTRMKHARRPERVIPLPPAYFARLNEAPGASYVAHLDKESGLPVSFDLVLDGPDGWIITMTGSDGRRDLYFDLYLRGIARMIAGGVPTVALGPGMQGLKASFGAEPEPRYAVAAPLP